MKKNEPKKNLPESRRKSGILGTLRMYISIIRIIHKGLGPLRIIAAYLFVVFAVLSLIFTIKMPVRKATVPGEDPTGWEKAQSRLTYGFMIVVNLMSCGMIMNWRRVSAFRTTIRISFIALVAYLNVFLLCLFIYRGTFL